MKNTCFFNVGAMGMGDYLTCLTLAIFLKNKYEHIYLMYTAVHFNGLMYLSNRLLEENNANNITLIGDSMFRDTNCPLISHNFLYKDMVQPDILHILDLYKDTYETDSNGNTFIYFHSVVSKSHYYHCEVYNYFGININMIQDSIQFKLNDKEQIINNNNYDKLSHIISHEKYVLVFHCIERSQYNFSFRDYPNEYNKNNYKIINICKRCDNNTNIEYYIDELIINSDSLCYFHKIIENAEELHMFDSYPLLYFSYIIKKHKKVICFPRAILGYIDNNSYTIKKKLNKQPIFSLNLDILNHLYETHYPLCYFKKHNLLSLMSETNPAFDVNYNTNSFFLNVNEHNNNFEKRVYGDNHILYKVLPITCCNTHTGILTDTILNNINFIEIDLNDTPLWQNVNNICCSINEVINKITNDTNIISLNILLIKTSGDFILKIKPFMDNMDDELDTNYKYIHPLLIETIECVIENKKIHYVYPYSNENDKNNFKAKLTNYSKLIYKEIGTSIETHKVLNIL